MSESKTALPFSCAAIFRSGYASDMTISAGGKTFKFHQPVVAACSPVLAAALEFGKEIELKCSATTIEHVHTIIYGGAVEAKTLDDAWNLYRFAEQYDIKFIKNVLDITILKIIDTVDIADILKTLPTFDIKLSQPFTNRLFTRLTSLMRDIGKEEKFCENKTYCCRHGVECKVESKCCKCRTVLSDDAVAYMKIELAKIYEQVLTLPAAIQAKLFYWLV